MLEKIKIAPLYLLIVIWLVFLLDFIIPIDFNNYGIIPRTLGGLKGIVFAPILHADLQHIMLNSAPLFILGLLIYAFGRTVFTSATIIIWLLSGIIVWLFSSPAIVIGASGLLFGYWSFLITQAILHKSLKSFIIAGLVMILYGSLFFSLFSVNAGVSWMGHAGGFLSGIVAGFMLKPKPAY